jgi:hypothetical protein
MTPDETEKLNKVAVRFKCEARMNKDMQQRSLFSVKKFFITFAQYLQNVLLECRRGGGKNDGPDGNKCIRLSTKTSSGTNIYVRTDQLSKNKMDAAKKLWFFLIKHLSFHFNSSYKLTEPFTSFSVGSNIIISPLTLTQHK